MTHWHNYYVFLKSLYTLPLHLFCYRKATPMIVHFHEINEVQQQKYTCMYYSIFVQCSFSCYLCIVIIQIVWRCIFYCYISFLQQKESCIHNQAASWLLIHVSIFSQKIKQLICDEK